MSVTQITYRRVFNAYLVAEDDGLTLIDTGPASAREAVRAAVTAQGGRLRRIVLTHAHADHVAGVDGLVIEHPDVEIIVGWREAALLAGNLVWRWPFPAFSTWNTDVALASARRLLDAAPRRLATGHGPVVEHATRALGAAIAAV